MTAHFLELACLSDALAQTSRKLEKRALISDWLRTLLPEDAALGAMYLAGQPFAETDRRALNLGSSLLTKAVVQITGSSLAELHQAYLKHGDLGAAAFELMAPLNQVEPSLLLSGVETAFVAIAAARGTQAKLQPLLGLLTRATPVEAKYLIKLALGDMRTGVRQSLIEEAIAAAYSADLPVVRRALMLAGDLRETVKMAAVGSLGSARMNLFHSLGFMLASPVDSVDEAMARFVVELAEEHVDPTARPLTQAYLEDKYDGIRCQLHCGDPDNPGRVALFSRTREDLTASFPELVTAFVTISTPVILDGEILAWDPMLQRARPFSTLQQRIGRKKVSEQMQRNVPVVFMAFDMLYRNGELLLGEPLEKRRHSLEEFLTTDGAKTVAGIGNGPDGDQSSLFLIPPDESAFARLILSPAAELASPEQLEQAYMDARGRGNEGVMIKSRNSLYQPGRRGLAWLKLKRELATLDVVVTAAEFGHGRRASVLSDYTFAIRDGEHLRNVGKAYSGLTDLEIDQLTAFFHDHTLEDYGRVRTVEPLVVLEVAFNNVMRSDRHDSGFALRFPRILRIRNDKPLAEIDTLQRVEEIYSSQPDKPHEELAISEHENDRDVDELPLNRQG